MTTTKLARLAGAALLVLALGAATAPALAFDTGGGDTTAAPAPAVPTLAEARADIKARNWTEAIAKLKLFVAANTQSADGFNLLGYSYRNAGSYDLAGKAYARALKLDPRHLGALEYQGVLFIKLGQTDKARANLAKLKSLCGTTCEEYEDLAKAIG